MKNVFLIILALLCCDGPALAFIGGGTISGGSVDFANLAFQAQNVDNATGTNVFINGQLSGSVGFAYPQNLTVTGSDIADGTYALIQSFTQANNAIDPLTGSGETMAAIWQSTQNQQYIGQLTQGSTLLSGNLYPAGTWVLFTGVSSVWQGIYVNTNQLSDPAPPVTGWMVDALQNVFTQPPTSVSAASQLFFDGANLNWGPKNPFMRGYTVTGPAYSDASGVHISQWSITSDGKYHGDGSALTGISGGSANFAAAQTFTNSGNVLGGFAKQIFYPLTNAPALSTVGASNIFFYESAYGFPGNRITAAYYDVGGTMRFAQLDGYLNASELATGTVGINRLPSDVLYSDSPFGTQSVPGAVIITNAANVIAGNVVNTATNWTPFGTLTNSYKITGAIPSFYNLTNTLDGVHSTGGVLVYTNTAANGAVVYLVFNDPNYGPRWDISTNYPDDSNLGIAMNQLAANPLSPLGFGIWQSLLSGLPLSIQVFPSGLTASNNDVAATTIETSYLTATNTVVSATPSIQTPLSIWRAHSNDLWDISCEQASTYRVGTLEDWGTAINGGTQKWYACLRIFGNNGNVNGPYNQSADTRDVILKGFATSANNEGGSFLLETGPRRAQRAMALTTILFICRPKGTLALDRGATASTMP